MSKEWSIKEINGGYIVTKEYVDVTFWQPHKDRCGTEYFFTTFDKAANFICQDFEKRDSDHAQHVVSISWSEDVREIILDGKVYKLELPEV